MSYDMRVNTGGSWSKVAVATAAGTTIDFGSYTRVWLKASVDTHVRFAPGDGTTIAVTTNDGYLTGGVDYVLDVTPTGTRVRGKKTSTASTGTLYWKPVA